METQGQLTTRSIAKQMENVTPYDMSSSVFYILNEILETYSTGVLAFSLEVSDPLPFLMR